MVQTPAANNTYPGPPHGGRTAPGPRGMPILGSWAPMRRQGMLKFWTDVWRRYGDVAHVQMGPINTHLVVHPDHVHAVLVRNRDNYARGILVRRVRVLFGSGLLTSEGESYYALSLPLQALARAQAALSL